MDDLAEVNVSYLAIAVVLLASTLLLVFNNTWTVSSSTTPKPDTNDNDNNNNKKKAVVCPFSAQTEFFVETAEHLPETPMDLFESWEDEDNKPLGVRWLNANLSGQDTPGMLRAGLKKFRNSKFFLIQDRLIQDELIMKRKALDDTKRRPFVLVAEDDSLEAQQETLDLFLSYLPRRYPELYKYDKKAGTVHVVPINETFVIDEYYQKNPIELCERIVQEDLVLMRPPREGESSYAMAAAVVVFSFSELQEKLGKPVEFIHAPVPGYGKFLQKSLNLTFSKIRPEQPLWRNNWGIAPSGELDKPLYGSETANKHRRFSMPTIDQIKSKYLKVEYQTLRRLPKTGYLLFTVRTFADPLDRLEEYPVAASCLARSIRGMSPQMRAYKGIDDEPTCKILLEYLDSMGEVPLAGGNKANGEEKKE